MIEECRVAGCNYQNVIAISLSAVRDLNTELTKARAREVRLAWINKRYFVVSIVVILGLSLVLAVVLLVTAH